MSIRDRDWRRGHGHTNKIIIGAIFELQRLLRVAEMTEKICDCKQTMCQEKVMTAKGSLQTRSQ